MPLNNEQEVALFNLIQNAKFDSSEITYAKKQEEVCGIVENMFNKSLIEWLEGTKRYTKVVVYWENHKKCVESFFSIIIKQEKALKNYKEPKNLYYFIIKCFSNYLKREQRRINKEEDKIKQYGAISLDSSYSGYSGEVNKIDISTLKVDDDPQAAVFKNEMLDIVKEVMDKAQRRNRTIFALYYNNDLHPDEIAKLLNISTRQVMRLAASVSKILRQKLSKYFNVKTEIFDKVPMKDITDGLKTLGFDI
ncbi:MAG: sigma-70 family RNA polymerase sigma factor [Candidatus Brocadiaceae bacterium]|nr:sigma-70 family RNA polymerase sigma factor [Candidatus Brocadiaceae bacterium]